MVQPVFGHLIHRPDSMRSQAMATITQPGKKSRIYADSCPPHARVCYAAIAGLRIEFIPVSARVRGAGSTPGRG